MRNDGAHLVAFAERFGRLTKGRAARKPLVLEPFQRQLLLDLGNSGARRAYIQLSRKNGKSMLGAIIALHGLCADGEEGAEVYSVAGSREQAGLVFEEAKAVIRYSPALSKRLRINRNVIFDDVTGSRYKALAAEAGTAEGLNPHLVIFDEVHVLESRRELWDVMNLGSGTREAPLVLAITTPGVLYGKDGRPSLAHTLYQYGKRIESGEVEDSSFFFRAWEADAGSDVHDETQWAKANPGLGKFLTYEDMRSAVKITPENEFKTKRMGLWVASATSWLPYGAWEKCEDNAEAIEPGRPVVLGFDGSKSRDATALVGATVEANPKVFVVKVWERPLNNMNHSWQVPREDVTETVLAACERFDVRELVADSALWLSELQQWEEAGVPVIEYPQTPSRMVPATQRFYEAVVTEEMKHDGNPVIARHLAGATVKPSGQIAKEHKDSEKKIDAAVAAIMAYDRAAVLGKQATIEFFVM